MMRPKLLFVVTEDRYFHSHRLPMARAAQNAGFDVAVITRVGTPPAPIEAAGIRVIPFAFARGSVNPLKAVRQIAGLRAIYRRERPAALHHIAMQPVLYGAIAAWLAQVPRIVNAFAGLGYVFTARDLKAKILRRVLTLLFLPLLKRPGSYLLLQNRDDESLLERLRLTPRDRTLVIPGSGVDLTQYEFTALPSVAPDFIAVFSGRMIDIKGLPTLRAAFAILAATAPHIKLWLCGAPDPANPGSWSEEALRGWAASTSNIVYRGQQTDMRAVWAQAHAALQPSWGGEGVPKALLEAAACGRPLIATDVPGCRDLVTTGVNGLCVPPRDAAALADAIRQLAGDPALGARYGAASRARVEAGNFSADAVERASASFYLRLLPRNRG